MATRKYLKSNEKDFEGAPDWATMAEVSEIGTKYFLEGTTQEHRFKSCNTGKEYINGHDADYAMGSGKKKAGNYLGNDQITGKDKKVIHGDGAKFTFAGDNLLTLPWAFLGATEELVMSGNH